MALTVVSATKQLDNKQAITNCAYTDPETYESLKKEAGINARSDGTKTPAIRCEVKFFVLNVLPDKNLPSRTLAVSHVQRSCCRISLDESFGIQPWKYTKPLASMTATTVKLALTPVNPKASPIQATDASIEAWCREVLTGHVLTLNQSIFVDVISDSGASQPFFGSVLKIDGLDLGVDDSDAVALLQGVISNETEFLFDVEGQTLNLKRTKISQRNLFKADFNFEQLGIGGLDKEFADIFRRAFASRIYPPEVIEQLGITHVRGMLLYGPPGTGKTLIARQIGKALRAKEPKIVNGPEILNKFVGQSEENIRKLFGDAEADQKKLGSASPLHIIIFDEIDAICKSRGTVNSGTGVNDSVVNQLLSKIDGVEALNNILLIGMTNRMDMLDEALLRPGRLEVHIEISLPDEAGRLQILNIHTKSMREAGRLGSDVSLNELAAETKNFSGAEIAGLIRSAVSYAFARNVDPSNITQPTDLDVKVNREDFAAALSEIKPAFGVSEDELSRYIVGDIINYSSAQIKVHDDLMVLTKQVQESSASPLISVLLWGSPGSGKTALAAAVATKSGFPFVKIISPNNLLGYHETAKIITINKTFQDAYKSQFSLVILDDIERLIDYTSIGPRFSNPVLQALMILIKKRPEKEGRRLLIIGTTSEPTFIQDSGLLSAFQIAYHTPLIRGSQPLLQVLKARPDIPSAEAQKLVAMIYGSMDATSGVKIPIKSLLMALEMAGQTCKPGPIDAKTMVNCLKDYGVQLPSE